MHFVQCPFCGDLIVIPADIVGDDCTDPPNFVDCDRCEVSFAYEVADLQSPT
jgi:transcription elongation factor Elf1